MPPSIPYYNRSAPFWDFVADLEHQGQNHPIFAGPPPGPSGEEAGPGFPWAWAARQFAQSFGQNAPPPAEREEPRGMAADPPSPPPPGFEEDAVPENGEGSSEPMLEKDQPEKPAQDKPHDKKGRACHGGRAGFRGRGGWGPRGRGGFPPGPRPFQHSFGPGRCGPGGPYGPFNLNALAQFFQEQMLSGQADRDAGPDETGDFKPAIDVFDTETSFIVHISVPGAKKEDVAVSWDAERSELTITGVVHRPGDEELLKTLALGERQVGAFERKVRLGSRANPAQVDVEGITAKLEDGILRIDVLKEDKDYVEIKKVDIE